jgi:hypothetical protein
MSRVVVVRLGLLVAFAVLALAGGALLTAPSAHADDFEIYIDPVDADRFRVELNGPGQIVGSQNEDNDSFVEINLTGTNQNSELRIILDQQVGDGRLGVERIETDSTSGIRRILGKLTVYLRGNGGESDGVVVPGDVEEIELWRVAPYGGIHIDGSVEEIDIRTDATFTPSGPLEVTGDIGSFFVRFLRIQDDEGEPASRGLLEAFTVGGNVVDIQINSQLTIDSGIASIGGNVGTLEVLRWVNIQNGGRLDIGGDLQSLIIAGASGAGNSLRMREDGNLTVGGLINTATLAGSLRLNFNSHIDVTGSFTDLVVGIELPGQGGGHLVIGDDSALTVGGALGHLEVFGSDPTNNISIWVRQSSLFTTGGGAPDITTYGDFRVVRGSYFEATALGDWSIGGNIHSAVAPGFHILGPGNHIETGGDVRILKDADFLIDGDLDSFNIFGELLVEGELVVDGFIRRLSADNIEVSAGSAPGLEITGGAGRINVNPGNFLVTEGSSAEFGGPVDEFLVAGDVIVDDGSMLLAQGGGGAWAFNQLLVTDGSIFDVDEPGLSAFIIAIDVVVDNASVVKLPDITSELDDATLQIGGDLIIHDGSDFIVQGDVDDMDVDGLVEVIEGSLLLVEGAMDNLEVGGDFTVTNSEATLTGYVNNLDIGGNLLVNEAGDMTTGGSDNFDIGGTLTLDFSATLTTGPIQSFAIFGGDMVVNSDSVFTAASVEDWFVNGDLNVVENSSVVVTGAIGTFEAAGDVFVTLNSSISAAAIGVWVDNLTISASTFSVGAGGIGVFNVGILIVENGGHLDVAGDIGSFLAEQITVTNGSDVEILGDITELRGPNATDDGIDGFSITDGSTWTSGGIEVFLIDTNPFILSGSENAFTVTGPIDNFDTNGQDVIVEDGATFEAQGGGGAWAFNALMVENGSFFLVEAGGLSSFIIATDVTVNDGSQVKLPDVTSEGDDATLQIGGNLLVEEGSQFHILGEVDDMDVDGFVEVLNGSLFSVGDEEEGDGPMDNFEVGAHFTVTSSEVTIDGYVNNFEIGGQLLINEAGDMSTGGSDNFDILGGVLIQFSGELHTGPIQSLAVTGDFAMNDDAVFTADSIEDWFVSASLLVDDASVVDIAGALGTFESGTSLVSVTDGSSFDAGSIGSWIDDLVVWSGSHFGVAGDIGQFEPGSVDVSQESDLTVGGDILSWVTEAIEIHTASEIIVGGRIGELRGPNDIFDGVSQLTIESDSLFQAGSIGTIRLDSEDFELIGAAVFNVIGRIDDFELVDIGMILDEGATFFAGAIGDWDITGILTPAARGEEEEEPELCLLIDNGSELTVSGVVESFNCGGDLFIFDDSAMRIGSAPGDFDISGELVIANASLFAVTNGDLTDFSADFVDIFDGSSMEISGNVGSFIVEFGIVIFEASSLTVGGNLELLTVLEGDIFVELDSVLSITGNVETIEAFGFEPLPPPAARGPIFGGNLTLTESLFNVGGTLQNFRMTGFFIAQNASTWNVGNGLGSFRVNSFVLNTDSLFNVGGAAGIGSMAGPFFPEDGIDGMLILNSSTFNVSAGPLQSLVVDGFADFNGGAAERGGVFIPDAVFEYAPYGIVLDEKATFFVAGDFGHLDINGVEVFIGQPPAERGKQEICFGGLMVDNGSTIHAGSAGSWEVNCQAPIDEETEQFAILPYSTIVDSGSLIEVVGNMGSFLDELGVQITSASTFTMGSLSNANGDSTWQTGGSLIISQGSLLNVATNADEIRAATLFIGEGSDVFVGGFLRSLWVTGGLFLGDRGGLPEFWLESGSVFHVNGNVDSILVGFPATANLGMNDNSEISVDGTVSSFTVTGGVGMEDNSLIRVGGDLLSLQIAGEDENGAQRGGALFNGLEMYRASDIVVVGDLGSLSASFEGPVNILLQDSSTIVVNGNIGSIFAEDLDIDTSSLLHAGLLLSVLRVEEDLDINDGSELSADGGIDSIAIDPDGDSDSGLTLTEGSVLRAGTANAPADLGTIEGDDRMLEVDQSTIIVYGNVNSIDFDVWELDEGGLLDIRGNAGAFEVGDFIDMRGTGRISVGGNLQSIDVGEENENLFTSDFEENSRIFVGGNLDDFIIWGDADLSNAGRFTVNGNLGSLHIEGQVDMNPGGIWQFGDAAADTVGSIFIADQADLNLDFNDLRGAGIIQASGSVQSFMYCASIVGSGGLNGTIRLAYMGGNVGFFGPCEEEEIEAARGGITLDPQFSGLYNVNVVVGNPGPDGLVDTADDVADATIDYFGASELSPRLDGDGDPVSNGSNLTVMGSIGTIEIGVYVDVANDVNDWGFEFCGMWRSRIVAEDIGGPGVQGQVTIQGGCDTNLDPEEDEILDEDGNFYDPDTAMLDSQIYFKGRTGPGNETFFLLLGDMVAETRETRIIKGFNGGTTFYPDTHLTIEITDNGDAAIGLIWDAAVAASVSYNDILSARPLLYDAGEDPTVPGGGFISHSEAVIGPGTGDFDDTNYYALTVTP